MLTWCSAGALVTAVLVVVRWVPRRRDVLGRRRPFPVVSVAVLVLGGLALVPVARHAQLERSLSQVASSLVGFPVEVHCQTFGEELASTRQDLGFVRVGADGRPEHRTTIMREPCDALSAYLGSDRTRPPEEQLRAVHVLSHEARHMAGELDEARAECEAMQRDAKAARLLGAAPAQARRLARYYWLVIYHRMPPTYVSADCGPGRAWDEHLSDPPWATG